MIERYEEDVDAKIELAKSDTKVAELIYQKELLQNWQRESVTETCNRILQTDASYIFII